MDGYEVCGHLKANPNAEHPRDFSYPRKELPAGPIFLVFKLLEVVLGSKNSSLQ